ncbi:MAG: hypothetical protein RIS64_1776 [Bacteroidota bacterium]|jgi:5-methylcytosine-specific restriction endonuclease McrA
MKKELNQLQHFTPAQKRIIFERDGHQCVICGNGIHEGVKLYADFIQATDFGGKTIIENGQTLCSKHHVMKKVSKQTDSGKKMFLSLQAVAKSQDDLNLQQFCIEILDVFDKHKINGHIEWKK